MVGTHRNSKKNRLPRFLFITIEMVRSDAWKNLSSTARDVYVLLKSKKVKADDFEVVTLSYNEMEEYIDRHTIKSAIDQLIENGFITITQRGGLHRKRNYYHFSNQWRNIKRGQKQVLFFTPSTVGISTPSDKSVAI